MCHVNLLVEFQHTCRFCSTQTRRSSVCSVYTLTFCQGQLPDESSWSRRSARSRILQVGFEDHLQMRLLRMRSRHRSLGSVKRWWHAISKVNLHFGREGSNIWYCGGEKPTGPSHITDSNLWTLTLVTFTRPWKTSLKVCLLSQKKKKKKTSLKFLILVACVKYAGVIQVICSCSPTVTYQVYTMKLASTLANLLWNINKI